MLEMLGASIWMFVMTILGSRNSGPEFPTDPASRSKHYVSHCLSLVKNELARASVDTIEEGRIDYRPERSTERRSLYLEKGNVMQRVAEGKPVQVSQLGEEAMLHFERPSEGQLAIRIAGGATPAVRHEVNVRLSVK